MLIVGRRFGMRRRSLSQFNLREWGNVDSSTLNTISLCSGVGMLDEGLHAGLEFLGIRSRTVMFAEREAFAVAVLAARMEEGSLAPAPIWFGDFTELPARRFRGLVDGVVAGFPCFVAGTLILSRAGFIPIESLSTGDSVLTHTGQWRPITSVMRRSGAGLRRVQGAGVLETFTTDEHPYYARKRGTKWNSERRCNERTFDEPEWVEAKNISPTSGHFASQVLPPIEQDDRTVAWWWLVGRYLADGWRVDRAGRKNGRVVICCNKQEAEEITDRIIEAGFVASRVDERTVCKFHITRGDFYEFLAPFGRLAAGKTLPGFALCLDVEKSVALFDGWISGDGWRNEQKRQWSGTTVSKSLALGMALLSQRAFGVVAGVYAAAMPAKCIIEGRECSQQTQYTVRVCDVNRSSFVEGNYGWKLLRKSESAGTGDVFNISVEGDESYIANGAIVHNCQDLSVAGRRAGIDGKRSGLFFNVLDIADDSGAWFLLLENVAGIASATASVMDEEEGELEERAAARVMGELADRGWNAEWITLSASDVGASHGRARWFCFAWRMADTGLQHSDVQQRGARPEHSGGNIELDDAARHGRHGLDRQVGRGRGVCQAGDALADIVRIRPEQGPRNDGGEGASQGSPEFEFRIGGRGEPLADAQSIRAGSRSLRVGGESAIASVAASGKHMADANGARLQGLQRRGGANQNGREITHGSISECRSIFAPGPTDSRWPGLLTRFPWLAPAIGDEASESLLRGVVNGMAGGVDFSYRAARLRAGGNGVVPLCAASAVVVLVRRSGIQF
jgi:DNA (cytosine-5)-methyltransferase 1